MLYKDHSTDDKKRDTKSYSVSTHKPGWLNQTFETSKGINTTNIINKDESSMAKNKTFRIRHKSSHLDINNSAKKRLNSPVL